ncbi:MAG: hypothetical protein V1690_03650 [Candidatus Moraniibacteriota bacterium]
MSLDKYQREEFAKNIVSAADLSGSFEGDEFVGHFREFQGVNVSNFGQNQITDWIKYEKKSEARNFIKHNTKNPKAVLDYLIKNVNPK